MSGRWACLALCALALAGCSRQESKPPAADPVSQAPGLVVLPPDSPKLAQIRVDTVMTANVPIDEVVSPGKIEVNPQHVSHVILPVTGRVTAVLVAIGDAVRQGQPLVTMESPDADAAESAFVQSQAATTQARANLVKAQADYDRAADLFAHNAVAKKDVLNTENALAQARAALEQAGAGVQQSGRRLAILGLKPGSFGQKVVVPAPMAGKVLEISVAPGEYRNDTNSAVMTIADLATVWVSSDVPETYIRFVQRGEPVDVTLSAYPGEVFRARVTRIADTVDPQTRTVKVRAQLNNPGGRLRPEMFGTIRHTEGMHRVTVLPPGAVIQSDNHSFVFKESAPGRFRQTEVETGKRSGDWLPVRAGVQAGDRVVVDGAMLLKSQ